MRAFARWISPQPLAAKGAADRCPVLGSQAADHRGGEAASDSLAHDIAVGAAVDVALIVTALFFQFRTRRYVAAAYWYLALAIATFGTGAADVLHLQAGLPYTATTLLWAAAPAVVFWRWHRSEGRLLH